ncbi:MAG: PQQ-like beta-propeller repeat protein, partial [Candidatus Glassbacteria bacterium]|nr:PQQ-like beta-propeller repeat protein [Candidatus Glassbacteria bacterium]
MKITLRFSLLFLAWFSLIPVSARPAAPAPGILKWRFPAGREELSLAAAGDTEFTVSIGGAIEYSCPAIAADGTVYFGSHNGCLYAINPDGTLVWQFWTGGKIMKSPVIDTDGTVYIGSDDNYLYALDPQGRQKWRHHAASWFSSPALGADGSLYAGTGDGYLYALDHDGTFKWRFRTGKYPKVGAVGSDGTIYIGTWLYDQSHNMFYAVNPDG